MLKLAMFGSLALILVQTPGVESAVPFNPWALAERGGAWALLIGTLWAYRSDVGALARASMDVHRETALQLAKNTEVLAHLVEQVRRQK